MYPKKGFANIRCLDFSVIMLFLCLRFLAAPFMQAKGIALKEIFSREFAHIIVDASSFVLFIIYEKIQRGSKAFSNCVCCTKTKLSRNCFKAANNVQRETTLITWPTKHSNSSTLSEGGGDYA